MAERRRFLRPIDDLQADAMAVAAALDRSSMPDAEVAAIATQTAGLVTELIGELQEWRTLIGHVSESSGPARFTVMVGPEGMTTQVTAL